MKKISCIIPAYNEEAQIGATLEVVSSMVGKELYEVIVIDDGSVDNTVSIIKKFPTVHAIFNEENQGKSRTVARGISEVSGDFIFLLDADLLGLQKKDINALIEPIEKGMAEVVLSIRKDSPRWMHYIGVDLMTGERIMAKDLLLPHLQAMSILPSYGLEVFLNRIFIRNKSKIISVVLQDVYDEFQYKRRGLWRGMARDMIMWVDIFKTVPMWEWVLQNFALRKLIVKNTGV